MKGYSRSYEGKLSGRTSSIIKLAALAGLVWAFIACSPSVFEKPVDCGQGCTRIVDQGVKDIEYTFTVPGPRVDILIVMDNSGSMSFEQSRMSQRFQTFLNALDSQNLDYRVALTTTDVSNANNPPRAINDNGSLQDGKLVSMGNGSFFIESTTPNKLQLFLNAIGYIEGKTLACEAFINSLGNSTPDRQTYLANCPSDDERGVMAANLFVNSNFNSFLRDGSHFAVVFLGDEDERSSLYSAGAGYNLDVQDLPGNLIQNIQSRYAGKSFSFHSIIVRPGSLASGVTPANASDFLTQAQAVGNVQWPSNAQPGQLFTGGDQSCLAQQGQQTRGVSGSYGYIYALAALMTNGIIGDVCANDYGTQLQNIGANIAQQRNQINMACANPKILDLRYTNAAGSPPGSFEGQAFVLDPSIPVGRTVYLKIECPDT